jgi:hypothetical protein
MALERTQRVSNVPQKSLLGLPTELRLQIFSFLTEPIQFHVDSSNQDTDPRRWTFEQKRLCQKPDPIHPSLCSAPRFSGLTPTPSMCHTQSDKSANRLAIRAVCRLFRSEAHIMFKDERFGLTVEHHTVEACIVLSSMSAQQAVMLVDLTIQALPTGTQGGGNLAPVLLQLRNNFSAFSNLRTIAIQQPRRIHRRINPRCNRSESFDPKGEWRWQWYIVQLKAMYGKRVQIILEWWFVLRAGHPRAMSKGDEMVRTRGIVGDCDSMVCKCRFEMISKPIVKEQGGWTEYWKNRGMGFDKDYSPTRELFMDEITWIERYRYRCYPGEMRVAAWEASARRNLQRAEQRRLCRH